MVMNKKNENENGQKVEGIQARAMTMMPAFADVT